MGSAAAEWGFPLLAGVYGLLIGSFLNVCSLRWPMDQSVVRPRSRCPNCDTVIAWYDNVPVLSWTLLRGRCRHCKNPVSVQYPLVELTTGLVWAGVVVFHGPTWEALRAGAFLTILLGISISDARFYIIPDEFSVGGTGVGLAMSLLPGGIEWLPALVGAVSGYAVLWIVGVLGTWLIEKLSPGRLEEAGVDQAMGGGDIKMMMMIGAFLGPWGVALTVFLGSVLALVVTMIRALVSFALVGSDEEAFQRLIPFGVFLAGGAAVAYVWGEAMIGWYMSAVLGMPI
ncbi:MAG: prepilin peptidase [Gemmatimonadetes bacterium]|nr:prepilin peptidase [Gemmatimonadota bacterium]